MGYSKPSIDNECEGLDSDECSKNSNCMSLMVPMGKNLPAFTFEECQKLATCECQYGYSFYSDGGCKP